MNWPPPGFQPGPLNASTGWKPHRIELPLTVADDSHALLRLEFAAGHGPCPDLEIDIDGEHRSWWHPVVRRDNREEVYRHGPIAGDVSLEVPLPELAPGRHVIGITTQLDADAALGPVVAPGEEKARHREQFGNHFGSGITWHALSLVPGVATSELTVDLVATPLYVDAGELLELTVTVAPGHPWPSRAQVTFAGHTYDLDLVRPGRDYGQVRVKLAVPEFEGETVAAVSLGGRPPVNFPLRPCRKWTIHFIPHVHLDIGYTDVQGKVLELHSRNLDRALDALGHDDRFAFSVDGSMIVSQYLATRSEKHAGRLLSALRGGRLSVNAFHSLFLSGVASLEEIYRATYLAASLKTHYGVPINYANLTDVPSYSAAIPSVLNALGIQGFVGIENHHRGGNGRSDEQHLASPVMWEGLDGSRVLTHFSDTYSQLRFMLGDPQTVAGGAHAFCRLLSRYDRQDYLPHDLAVIGTHADNEDLADGDAGFAARWNELYRYPRMVLSTMDGYLDAVRPLADSLPVWHGDGGSYWEDGVGTGATVTAEYRRVQSALPAAEGLAALTALADPRYKPNRAVLETAWEGALYGCEHTWTWAHGNAHPHGQQVSGQLDWKRHQVHTAYRGALDETHRAMSQLGELITTNGPTLIVHNALSWSRDIEAEVEVLESQKLGGEILSDCDGLLRQRMTVADVPAFGYRTVPLTAARTLAPGAEDGASTVDGQVTDVWRPVPAALETERWHASLDPRTGAVTGLRHRLSGREVLNADAPWHLGQVLYALNGPESLTRGDGSGHDETSTPHSGVPHRHTPAPKSALSGRRPIAEPPDVTVHIAQMRPVGIRRTYDGWRLRTVGTAPSLSHIEVDVLLRDTSDRVDVNVSFGKEKVLAKESVYVAFPFAASDPAVSYDRQQGWVNPATGHAPGACHDWFTTQHAVVVEEQAGGPAVVWTAADTPLFTVGDIVRGQWAEHFSPSGTLLSWVLNNYWPTNTPPEQDGTFSLRYAFLPVETFDPVAASRFGREVRAEPVVSEVTWLDKFDVNPRPLPQPAASLLDLGLPEWVQATVAGAVTRDGLLIRLHNLSGTAGVCGVQHPHGRNGEAVLCYADEREISPLPVDDAGKTTVNLGPWQVVSLVLR